MDVYTEIFGNQFAENIGLSLLAYFESSDFPKGLLHDPKLNLLYLKAQVNKVLNDSSLSDDTRYALIGAALDAYYGRGEMAPS